MTARRQVDDFTRDILARSTIEGMVVKLPAQLERADYQRVDKVLRGIGGRWDRKLKGHVFDFDPRGLVDGAAEAGTYTDRKQDLQFFETPIDLAERMVDLAKVVAGETALEPSCGRGRLVIPLMARGANVTAVDIERTYAQHCRALGLLDDAINDDFLAWAQGDGSGRRFDVVTMNPPFTRGQDIKHIMPAWNLLARGGRLVAICSAGPMFREDRQSREFRTWLRAIEANHDELPRGTFRESGTDVATVLITATRRDA